MSNFKPISAKSRLTRLIWLSRLKIALPIAAVLGLFMAAGAVLTLEPWTKTATRQGTVVGLWHHGGEEPTPPPILTVELDDGPVVRVSRTEHLISAQGRRMLVQERVSRILGRRSYSFVRFLE